MSFFDFDGSPNKTSNSSFNFAFGGDSEASTDRKLNRSAFSFDWEDDANNTNDFGFNTTEEPSPKKTRTTPLKTNKVNSNQNCANMQKSKDESPLAKSANQAPLQGKVPGQGTNKTSRESPVATNKAVGQRMNEAAANFKKPSESTSPKKNLEGQIQNKNLQFGSNGKHKDDPGSLPETANLENTDGGKVLNKNHSAENYKSANGERKNDKISADEVLRNSLGRLHAKIASIGPQLKKQEEADEQILDKASHLLSEIVKYRENLEETKHNFCSRLTQVASFLSQERK